MVMIVAKDRFFTAVGIAIGTKMKAGIITADIVR